MLHLYAAEPPTLPHDFGRAERRREVINAAALVRQADMMRRFGRALFWIFIGMSLGQMLTRVVS